MGGWKGGMFPSIVYEPNAVGDERNISWEGGEVLDVIIVRPASGTRMSWGLKRIVIWKVKMIGGGKAFVREVIILDNDIKYSYVILSAMVNSFHLVPERG